MKRIEGSGQRPRGRELEMFWTAMLYLLCQSNMGGRSRHRPPGPYVSAGVRVLSLLSLVRTWSIDMDPVVKYGACITFKLA